MFNHKTRSLSCKILLIVVLYMCFLNRNSSQVGCFIKVSRKTRRVSKENRGGQLQEVGFEPFLVSKMCINLFAHLRRLFYSQFRGLLAWSKSDVMIVHPQTLVSLHWNPNISDQVMINRSGALM